MSPSTPTSTEPIRIVIREFAETCRSRLDDEEFSDYRRVLFFLELCINNYGHRNLSSEERVFYEQHYHRGGEAGRHFFELFGAEKLLPELDFFAQVYVKRHVFTSRRLEKRAPGVVEELTAWLVERGYVLEDDVALAARRARERKKRRRLHRDVERRLAETAVSVDRSFFTESDYIDCDDHPIERVDHGRFWLRVFRSATPERIGPLLAPVAVTEALRVGWNLSCALAKVRGRWRLVRVEELYPNFAAVPLARGTARDYNRTLPEEENHDDCRGHGGRARKRVREHPEDARAASRG